MSDKKLRMKLDFDKEELFLEDSHQKGTQWEPHLAERAQAVAEATGTAGLVPHAVDIDMNTNEVTLTFHVDDLESRQDSILAAAGLITVDISNGRRLAELFMQGKLPPAVFSKALSLEGESVEPNKDVTEFLRIIEDGITDTDEPAK